MARSLAELLGAQFAGEYDPAADYGEPLYFVPREPVVGLERAHRLGIRSRDDLFGSVVPVACATLKTIVHPLVSANARAPDGWPESFAQQVREVVLPGFSAYTLEDAHRAASLLLMHGPVRLKPGEGVGGRGQKVVRSPAELDTALAAMNDAALEHSGVVVETQVEQATTYSVGQVWAGGILASYCGTQKRTTDNQGRVAYGGSDLWVVRGGFDQLGGTTLAQDARTAVQMAKKFDSATEALEGFFASRRNYDVVCGQDARGRRCCGVLEPSWRLGGASGAEIAAVAAFKRHPTCRLLRAVATEAYGRATAPPDAVVYFSGTDDKLGELIKYSEVQLHEAQG